MNKIDYTDKNGHRATLSFHDQSTIWDVADQFRLLVQIMGFTPAQAREILPTEADWEEFYEECYKDWKDTL